MKQPTIFIATEESGEEETWCRFVLTLCMLYVLLHVFGGAKFSMVW